MSLVSSFTPLIQSALNNTISNSRGINDSINNLINETSECTTSFNLLNNISKRNNLVNDINQMISFFDKLSNYINIIDIILESSKLIISIFKSNPAPSQFTTIGLIITLNDIFDKTKIVIEQIDGILSVIKKLINYILNLLKGILELLKILDLNLSNCLNKNKISSNLIPVNNINTNTSSDIILKPYKGYNFDIKIDEYNNTPFTKRYAVAINSYGVIVLRSESSFASDPNVLVEELKFKIDQQNL